MAIVMIFSFSLITFGDGILEQIEAYWAHDIKFQLDGKMWEPKEADGSRISPIIFKGRTYVPARALLEEKDVKVAFDEATRTISLDYPEIEKPGLPKAPEPPMTPEPPKIPEPPVAPQAPEWEPPWGTKSFGVYIQKSDIGGPYKEWPNYDFLFDLLNKADGPGITTTFEMELADDALFMINGKETNLKDLDADEAAYYFIIDPKDKITVGIDPKTKLVKSTVMNLKERKPGDGDVGRMTPKRLAANHGELIITIEPQEEVYYGKVVWRPRK